MLHFARRVAEQQLTQIDRWIAAEERREAERQHGIAARPPAPDWLIEHGLSGQDSMYVHTGDCWNAGKRSKGVTRDTALRALTEGGAPACPHCRPDTALGILEGLFRRCSAAVRSSSSPRSSWPAASSPSSSWSQPPGLRLRLGAFAAGRLGLGHGFVQRGHQVEDLARPFRLRRLGELTALASMNPRRWAAAWPSTEIENKFKEAWVKRPSEHDQVPPGLQVPSSACRREGPDLRSAP